MPVVPPDKRGRASEGKSKQSYIVETNFLPLELLPTATYLLLPSRLEMQKKKAGEQ